MEIHSDRPSWFRTVRDHYDRHPYPSYPLLGSIPLHDTYAMNLQAVWSALRGEWLEPHSGRILLAGCGAFAPYPSRLANRHAGIDALDLSTANLRRARLHCLIHGCRGINFSAGDFLDPLQVPGPYHLIDAFGVLHHLTNPFDGFRALEKRLAPGGILRVMVYGRYARQEAESIRRAARLLHIRDVASLKQLIRRAPAGSRLREYLAASWEARTDSGLADLFFHPCVHTYRIDEFLPLCKEAGLTPLRFTHTGARPNPEAEIVRLRELDRRRETLTNIVCYLGRASETRAPLPSPAKLLLNPSLAAAVSRWQLSPVRPMNRLGQENPLIDAAARSFLRKFRLPVEVCSLSDSEKKIAQAYADAWYLLPLPH